jgi:hypothetical protein
LENIVWTDTIQKQKLYISLKVARYINKTKNIPLVI